MTVLIVYCVFIAAASLAGGNAPSLIRLTHARMQLFVSLVGGFMLGIALFHMLPHAALETGSLDGVMLWVMIGLLTTFFLIRAFHFHQHASAEHEDAACGHEHGHDHDHGGPAPAARRQVGPEQEPGEATTSAGHRFNWIGMAAGLGIHSLLDGVAVAASVRSEAHSAPDGLLLGIGTAIAVFLHKPLDSMSIIALMAAGGWSPRIRQVVNFGYALLCPLGALAFWFGADPLAGGGQIFGGALAFSAGVFLCISLGDLLPEVQFHAHDRLKLSACLVAGVVLAWALRFFEPAHIHQASGMTGGESRE